MAKGLTISECGCSVKPFKGGYAGEVRIPRVDCKYQHKKGQRVWIKRKRKWKQGRKPRHDSRVVA